MQSIIQSAKNLKREFAEIDRLFADSNKDTRRLMFYAESSIYFRYYEDYIEYILQNSDLDVCYITSTADDEIFQHSNPRIKPFFIRNLLVGALQRFDGKVLVMTAPDLDTGAIKRAPHPVHHVYAFHGISSTHQYYRPAAFYNYDSILCIADYQVNEIRKTEQLYNLKPKNLVVTGYPLLERIYRQHQEYRKTHQPTAGQRPICLIAPTWAMDFRGSSILDSCIEELITAMSVTQFDVWVRPHPEFMKRHPDRIKAIEKEIAKTTNVSLQTNLSSMQCLHQADILITDYSTICVDFAIGTERPVLFIDTILDIGNPEWTRLGLEPVENAYRNKLGARLPLDKVANVSSAIEELFANRDEFKKTVPEIRDWLVANWQRAAQVGGDHILSLIR